ncbi:MAG: hypothetical protein ACTSW1_11060 [Candidatus Hodarchaeales archaeon]
MSTETNYIVLANIPVSLFERFMHQWKQTNFELKPGNLLSTANKDITENLIRGLPASKQRKLMKLARALDIKNIWWQPYQIQKIKSTSELLRSEKKISLDKYLEKDQVGKAKGLISSIELNEYAIFISLDFSSRVPNLRKQFRYLFFPSASIILTEQSELSQKLCESEIIRYLSKDDKMTKKRIKARVIKQFTKGDDDKGPVIKLTHLKIKISLETSGIEGLSEIVVKGNDVIRGAETLKQRHEVSLGFMQSGPWVGAGTEGFTIEVGKGLQITNLDEKSLKNVAIVLSWL